MATINVDDKTRLALESFAARIGLTLEDYLKRLAEHGGASVAPELSAVEFDSLVDELTIEAPPLPVDFSRADIYCDHD